MIRLYFHGGPYDGGSADFESTRPKSKKATRKGEVVLPLKAFVATSDGGSFVWMYRHTRTLTPYSAEYTLCGWVTLDELDRNAILLLCAA